MTQGSAAGFPCSVECPSETCGHKLRVRPASLVPYVFSSNIQPLKEQLLYTELSPGQSSQNPTRHVYYQPNVRAAGPGTEMLITCPQPQEVEISIRR